jgi:hypothetical protein
VGPVSVNSELNTDHAHILILHYMEAHFLEVPVNPLKHLRRCVLKPAIWSTSMGTSLYCAEPLMIR